MTATLQHFEHSGGRSSLLHIIAQVSHSLCVYLSTDFTGSIDHPSLGLPVNAMQWRQQCSYAEVVLLTDVMALTIPASECVGSTCFVMYFKCHASLRVESKTIMGRESVGGGDGPLTPFPLTLTSVTCAVCLMQ